MLCFGGQQILRFSPLSCPGAGSFPARIFLHLSDSVIAHPSKAEEVISDFQHFSFLK